MLKLICKSLAVTVVVLLGAVAGNAIGAPSWSQGLLLLPAVFLFLYLDTGGIPTVRRLWAALAFIVVVTAGSTAIQWLNGRINETAYILVVIFAILALFRATDWLENRFEKSPNSED